MKAFRIKGSHSDPRAGKQPFTIEIAAEDADLAREYALSDLGSRHRLKRWEIAIDGVSEIPNEEITDHVVRYKVTGE
ncbi:MAG: 50S ribosomal protein L18a [Thermoplasmatales archaeon]|nr:50S ribosomal protein L18a [Thermoplasmatales archaeon]